MGKSQRIKGVQQEYRLRDFLRRFGFTADRVPASGAAQGFPGDIRASKGKQELLFELKTRKSSFTKIYELFDKYETEEVLRFTHDASCVTISKTPDQAIGGGVFPFAYHFMDMKADKRTLNRFKTLKKMLKGSDILVIKDDYKPFLFISF